MMFWAKAPAPLMATPTEPKPSAIEAAAEIEFIVESDDAWILMLPDVVVTSVSAFLINAATAVDI